MLRKRYDSHTHTTTEPYGTEPSHWLKGERHGLHLFAPWVLASPQMTRALLPGGDIGGFQVARRITPRQLARWRRQQPTYDDD